MKLTLLLSGQGEVPSADAVTMWRCDPAARAVWQEAADTIGEPIDAWLDEGEPADTRRAQIISAIGSLATYAVVRREVPLAPAYVVGHSIGEVAALGIAAGLPVGTVAALVDARGSAMLETIARGEPTGMRAVVDPPADLAERIAGFGDVHVANHNSERQVVISGTLAALDAVVAGTDLRTVPLKVTGAFHTPLMQPAADRFAQAVADLPLPAAFGPQVVKNRTAQCYADGEDLVAELARQIVAPVRWADAVARTYEGGSQLALDLSSTGMLARMKGCPAQRVLAAGHPTAMDTVGRELRHVLAVEQQYDLAARALGAIVSTHNRQVDPQLYRERVIPAYQELRSMVGRAAQQPAQILDLVEQVLRIKDVEPAVRDRKLAQLRWRAARAAA